MKRVGVPSVAALCLVFLTSVPAWASEGQEGGKASLPQLDASLYPGLLFWLAVTFLLFFVMMKMFGVPGIEQTKALRKEAIDADLASARTASDAAQEIMTANEVALEEARRRAQKTVNDIIHAANSEFEEQRSQQHQDISHRLQVAQDNLNEVRNEAMKETPQFINDLVQEIVMKVMKTETNLIGSKG